MADRTIQQELDRNYEEFQKLLPTIIAQNRGRYALMRDGKIVNYFSTPVDARAAAEVIFTDSLFSIQPVTDMALDLGYFSYAHSGGNLAT
jgi:hypothetical protein